jgi:hypothetical protein
MLNILRPDIFCHGIRRLLVVEGAGDEVDYGLFVVVKGRHGNCLSSFVIRAT